MVSKLEIKQKGKAGSIKIDDSEIFGIRKITIHWEAGEIPKVTLWFEPLLTLLAITGEVNWVPLLDLLEKLPREKLEDLYNSLGQYLSKTSKKEEKY